MLPEGFEPPTHGLRGRRDDRFATRAICCNSLGAAGRSRTCIAPIKSRVLCPLSYDGTYPTSRFANCERVCVSVVPSSSSSRSDHPGAGSRNRTEGLRITGAALWPAKLSQRFFFIGPHLEAHLEPLRRLERRSARYKPVALPAELQRQPIFRFKWGDRWDLNPYCEGHNLAC